MPDLAEADKQEAFWDLPHNFLGVNSSILADSALKQRNVADLEEGWALLADDIRNQLAVADSLCHEDIEGAPARHARRGAALAELLVRDSVPGFQPLVRKVSSIVAEGASLEHPSPNAIDTPYSIAMKRLIVWRRALVRPLTSDLNGAGSLVSRLLRRVEISTQTDDSNNFALTSYQVVISKVLKSAGLEEEFKTALDNLNSTTLGEPTAMHDASYGAAVLVTRMGMSKFPAAVKK